MNDNQRPPSSSSSDSDSWTLLDDETELAASEPRTDNDFVTVEHSLIDCEQVIDYEEQLISLNEASLRKICIQYLENERCSFQKSKPVKANYTPESGEGRSTLNDTSMFDERNSIINTAEANLAPEPIEANQTTQTQPDELNPTPESIDSYSMPQPNEAEHVPEHAETKECEESSPTQKSDTVRSASESDDEHVATESNKAHFVSLADDKSGASESEEVCNTPEPAFTLAASTPRGHRAQRRQPAQHYEPPFELRSLQHPLPNASL